MDADVEYLLSNIDKIPNKVKYKIKINLINKYFYRLHQPRRDTSFILESGFYSYLINLDLISILNYYIYETNVVSKNEVNDIIRNVLM